MSDPYGYDGSSVNPDAFVTKRSDPAQETKRCLVFCEYEEFIDPDSGGFQRCTNCGREIDCEGLVEEME